MASSTTPQVKRTTPEGVRTWVVCPPLMPDYLRLMCGVHVGNQLLSCYNVGRCSKKWWKQVYAYLLDTSILNAYQLRKHARKHWSRQKIKKKGSFLRASRTAHGSYHGRANRGRPRTAAREVRLDTTLDHCPSSMIRN